MKIAFLILAHQRPEQLKRLVFSLDDPRFDFFIHIDAKSNIADFGFDSYMLTHSTLTLIPKRHKVYWGHISMVDAMTDLYRCALAKCDYDRFVMLSGEDYPLLSNDDIYEYLSQRSTDCINISDKFILRRIEGYWFYRLGHSEFVHKLGTALHILGIRKKPWFTVDGRKWDVCISSQWHALTRRSAQYVIDMLEKHPEIREYFRYSYAPDEFIVPTILRNAPFFEGEIQRAAIHYLKHDRQTDRQTDSTVAVFDEIAFDDAMASGKLFIRKVRAGRSDKLLELIDNARS